jgi:hypothetical protein
MHTRLIYRLNKVKHDKIHGFWTGLKEVFEAIIRTSRKTRQEPRILLNFRQVE